MKNGKFTKLYEVQPNEKQRESLSKAFKSLAEGFLMLGKNVTVNVTEANDNSVFAVLECGNFYDAKLIGPRGGIKTL
jgi:regulator of RNase E activity RraA